MIKKKSKIKNNHSLSILYALCVTVRYLNIQEIQLAGLSCLVSVLINQGHYRIEQDHITAGMNILIMSSALCRSVIMSSALTMYPDSVSSSRLVLIPRHVTLTLDELNEWTYTSWGYSFGTARQYKNRCIQY